MKAAAPATVDDYIADFPPDVQKILRKIRATIRKAAPAAKESISYRMPAYKLDGRVLIYFAAYAKHIGMYPAPRGSEELGEELEAYAGGKGTVQFPLDRPVPYDLIRRIVELRAATTRA